MKDAITLAELATQAPMVALLAAMLWLHHLHVKSLEKLVADATRSDEKIAEALVRSAESKEKVALVVQEVSGKVSMMNERGRG